MCRFGSMVVFFSCEADSAVSLGGGVCICATYRLVFRVTILQPFPEVHKYNTFDLLTVYLTMLAEVLALNCEGYRRYPLHPNLRYCSDVCCKTTK